MSDDSKGSINNYDIDKMRDEVTWTEEMSSTKPDCTKSESHSDNCDNNCDGDIIGGEEQESDDLEGSE